MNESLELEVMVVYSRGWVAERGGNHGCKYIVDLHTAGGTVERVGVTSGERLDELIEQLSPPEIIVHMERGICGTLMRGPGGSYFDTGVTMEQQIELLERGATMH